MSEKRKNPRRGNRGHSQESGSDSCSDSIIADSAHYVKSQLTEPTTATMAAWVERQQALQELDPIVDAVCHVSAYLDWDYLVGQYIYAQSVGNYLLANLYAEAAADLALYVWAAGVER